MKMRKNCLEGLKVQVGDRYGVVISNYSPNHIRERYFILFDTGKVELLGREDFEVVEPRVKCVPHKLYSIVGYKPLSIDEIWERDGKSFDISFCSHTECDNLGCRRNFNRTEGAAPYARFSVSDFKDKEGYCPTGFE